MIMMGKPTGIRRFAHHDHGTFIAEPPRLGRRGTLAARTSRWCGTDARLSRRDRAPGHSSRANVTFVRNRCARAGHREPDWSAAAARTQLDPPAWADGSRARV